MLPKDPAKHEEYRQKLKTALTGKKNKRKGKTYEESYGMEKAKELKYLVGMASKGRTGNKGKIYSPVRIEAARQGINRMWATMSRDDRIARHEALIKRNEIKKDPNGRADLRYANWRIAVQTRDNFTCRMCSKTEEQELQSTGKELHAHHIKG